MNCVTSFHNYVTFGASKKRTFTRHALKSKFYLKLHIKYMMSSRCKMLVKDELKKLGLHFIFVDLGEVDVMEDLSAEQLSQLKTALLRSGLELMDDKKAVLLEKIKAAVIEMIYLDNDDIVKLNFSDYLGKKLQQDYTYLANLFSEVQGSTIEQFVIAHKVERIKELMIYGKLNITEIAWKMNYSSVAHLSNQFKKATGLSPLHFNQLRNKRDNPVEEPDT